MEKMVLTLHILVCVVLVLLVLLQSGKEGMGVIFGGGSASLFGSSGAGGILVKLTTFVAIIFLATSLGYTMLTTVQSRSDSVIIDQQLDDPSAPTPQVNPARPDNGTAPSAPAPAEPEMPSVNAPVTPAPAEQVPSPAPEETSPAN